MSNKYHAGTEYTAEQRDQLDAAFQAWLDADHIDANHNYYDENAHSRATATATAYNLLEAKFTAANVSTKRGVATGNERGFTSVKTAQMVAAATSDDAEMVAEMGNVKILAYGGRLAVVRLWADFDMMRFNLGMLFDELTESAEMADMEATYASACNRLGY